ncbi:MAG: hypothetical protein AAFQ87_05690, partial [Bacteroidota bacterium]
MPLFRKKGRNPVQLSHSRQAKGFSGGFPLRGMLFSLEIPRLSLGMTTKKANSHFDRSGLDFSPFPSRGKGKMLIDSLLGWVLSKADVKLGNLRSGCYANNSAISTSVKLSINILPFPL